MPGLAMGGSVVQWLSGLVVFGGVIGGLRGDGAAACRPTLEMG